MVLDKVRIEEICKAVEMYPILWDPRREISKSLRYIFSHQYTYFKDSGLTEISSIVNLNFSNSICIFLQLFYISGEDFKEGNRSHQGTLAKEAMLDHLKEQDPQFWSSFTCECAYF